MSTAFNADEIFQIAEQIEINGMNFYTQAAGQFADPWTKKTLTSLADWERTHQKIFAVLRAKLSEADRKATNLDPQGEAAQYLKALSDMRIFDASNPRLKLTGAESVGDVLRTAVGLEKDSVAFYVGMLELVPAELGKSRISDIIKEEMRHVTILTQALEKAGK